MKDYRTLIVSQKNCKQVAGYDNPLVVFAYRLMNGHLLFRQARMRNVLLMSFHSLSAIFFIEIDYEGLFFIKSSQSELNFLVCDETPMSHFIPELQRRLIQG